MNIWHEISVWAAQFNLALVVLAALVCAAGSFTVIALLSRAVAAPRPARWIWLGGVAVGFGADVWATHFIAMLAYDPKMPFSYRVAPTILSIFIAIGGSVLPFAAVILRPGLYSRIFAGVMLGLTIGAMHFVGMSAMEMGAATVCNEDFVVASLAVGIVMSYLMLDAASRSNDLQKGPLATLWLILAICGLHFTAMGGFSVHMQMPMLQKQVLSAAIEGVTLQHSTTQWLGLTVAGVSGLILLAAFSAVAADRKFAALQEREAERLQHFARHDELTNLPNRLFLRERLAQAFAAPAEARRFALFYIDLDRFKPINDLFGHHAGDLLLAKVAERIRGLIRDVDMPARFGGDEFIILQRATELTSSTVALAERLVKSLAEPIMIEDRLVQVGASIGIAFFPTENASIEDVLRNADTALYRAKAEGGGCYRFFKPAMSEQLMAQRYLEQDFHQALELQQFLVHYQPLFDCCTSALCGFEALVRWQHPIRGLIPPMEFIPFAEKSGLIIQLGMLVLEAACHEAAGWPERIRIAVNLSPVQLRRADLDANVLAVLQRTGLAPERLELEVTESALIESPEQALVTMTSLKEHGVQFAIDDFGTGYSSLTSLRQFPFDRIKIDRSFVQGLHSEADSKVIVRAIVGLGHSLRINVLAEGVETEEQLELLRELNCDQVQGYLLGRPITPEGIVALIDAGAAQAEEVVQLSLP